MADLTGADGGLRELALFAGAGGGILGGKLLGWRTVCAVELDAFARDVLVARQNDGSLEAFPIWDDIQTFDGRPWRGRVDVVSGGFPCQDISVAGSGAGITGERSGLWKHMARVVDEVRPEYVFVENSPMLVKRGLAVVLGDLASLGYDARWCVLGAHHVGAPHKRDRIWILAHANSARKPQQVRVEREERGWTGDISKQLADSARLPERKQAIKTNSISESGEAWDVTRCGGEQLANTSGNRREGLRVGVEESRAARQWRADSEENSNTWWDRDPADEAGAFERGMGRVVDGMANRLDRLRCLGNGQVPAVARLAWTILQDGGW